VKTTGTRSTRFSWSPIVVRARELADSYETPVTLRQLFYRLVSELLIPNTLYAYKRLSAVTAEARRDDEFPDLLDHGRRIIRPISYTSPAEALAELRDRYRRDRTEGQTTALYLGVEKVGLVEQLYAWFGELSIPIVPVRGYSSQTLCDEVAREIEADGRPAVLLYAGDFDPSGEDITRDFVKRVGLFADVRRIALSAEQVDEFELPPQPGKSTDPRTQGFLRRHGRLVQVELDALDPDELRRLYAAAIAEYWDEDAYRQVLEREQHEAAELPAGVSETPPEAPTP
jgi:hypothetical protein